MVETTDMPDGLRLNALDGVEVVRGWFRNHRIPKHTHDGLMLSVIDDGAQRIHYRGEVHLGVPGKVVAIPPGEVHAAEPHDETGWSYHTITIPTRLMQSLIGTKVSRFRCETLITDDTLLALLAHVFALFRREPSLALEEALLWSAARFMVTQARQVALPTHAGAEAKAVALCKAYLAARADQNVHLAELEAACGIDQFRLVKNFTRLEGLPPHAWHLQHRLDRAQDLLSRGARVADTAYMTGFADQAHFTRAFKRLLGTTPGRYRRSHLFGA